MSATKQITIESIAMQNTPWQGPDLNQMSAAFARAFLDHGLTIHFRGWKLLVTDTGAKGTNAAGEHFEIANAADFETALRLAKAKVNRLEGSEEWDEGYTNGALK